MKYNRTCIKCGSNTDVIEKIEGNWICVNCLNKYSLWDRIAGNCKECGLPSEQKICPTCKLENKIRKKTGLK